MSQTLAYSELCMSVGFPYLSGESINSQMKNFNLVFVVTIISKRDNTVLNINILKIGFCPLSLP